MFFWPDALRVAERRRIKSVIQILAPLFLRLPEHADQVAAGVEVVGPRLARKFQSGLFGGAVALAVVAAVAAGDEVVPRALPAARARHHVVERQLRRRQAVAAELAGIAVAQQDVLP